MALRHLGLAPAHPLLLLPLLLLPILLLRRPPGPLRGARASAGPAVLLVVVAAGWLHGDGWARSRSRDCRLTLAEGDSLSVTGVVSGAWSRGPLVDVDRGLPGGCRAELYVRPRGPDETPPPGSRVTVRGRWAAWGDGSDPERAGELRGAVVPGVETAASGADAGADADAAAPRGLAGRREAVRRRLAALFPGRHGLVAALVLARRDGIDPALREAFTRAGVAHLLAISGFHVGVLAVLVLGCLRLAGLRKRPAAVAGTAVVWAYVAFIGAPDAAVRAALLLGLVGAGVLRGRPVHRAGALAAALAVFLVADPGAAGRPGFQLSFLGAGGLVFLGPLVDGALRRRLGWRRGSALRGAVAVGVAATLATLPAVAWHFERVSLVGVPVTLLATPLVAVAIPGVLAALVADLLPPVPGGVAAFLAGGADLLLLALVGLVSAAGELDWATAWLPRGLLAAGLVGGAVALLLPPARGVGRDVRLLASVGGAVGAGALLAPFAAGLAGNTVEIAMLDVGQGDAIAVRSPRGRWLLVDAGPGPPRGALGPPAVARELRRRGVERLEALLLTHPDLDHVGGAAAVIEDFSPRFVGDPGHVRGTAAYVEGLEAGTEGEGTGVPWLLLRSGDRLDLDGVALTVLHPGRDPDPDAEPNASSLVLLLRFGAFTALLTGDAPADVEESVVANAGDVDLLKAAHHGSRTSSSRRFLEAVRPEVVLVSAGRRNRYGHPHPEVLGRLEEVAGRIARTDRDGTVRVVARRDGTWVVVRGGSPLGAWRLPGLRGSAGPD